MRIADPILCLLTCLIASGCVKASDVKPEPLPPQPKTPSMAEITAKCDALEANGVPAKCVARYTDGVLVMVVHFDQLNALEDHHAALDQDLDRPFCAAAKRSGEKAGVLEELHGQGHRVLPCDTLVWSPWKKATPPPPEPPNIRADATPKQNCEAINGARNVPIYCSVAYANGMYTMSIKFTDVADAEVHVRPMLLKVAAPFCASIKSSGDGGLVRLQRPKDGAYATYNCETESMSPLITPTPTKPSRATRSSST